jgi:hypothetical protein
MNEIDRLESSGSAAQRDQGLPPVADWDPPLSGDIDIEIDREGCWWHEGRPFEREALVRLFASILRRETDGHYYLVTPVEKWRIRVAHRPLVVTDLDSVDGRLQARLNTDRQIPVSPRHALKPEPDGAGAYLELENGLSATLSRPAWYRLAEIALADPEQGVMYVQSGADRFTIGALE